MEELLTILKSVKPGVDFENSRIIVSEDGEGLLDSLEFVAVLTKISEEFSIEFDGDDLDPINFYSVQAIWETIQRLQNLQMRRI